MQIPLFRIIVLGATLWLAGCAGTSDLDPAAELPVDCLTKPDPGSCRGAQTRYYYDYRDNRCKPFAYGGCDGRVPFETVADCVSHCGAEPGGS